MHPAIAAGALAAAALLIIWNARTWLGFQRDYRFDGTFSGPTYECNLRFANEEHSVQCLMGATASKLYLLAHPGRKKWSSYRGMFHKNLQIHWSNLTFRPGKMFFKECVWFEIPGRKIHFYVPRDVGEKLLRQAGHALPIEA